jgi:hypothetical protein
MLRLLALATLSFALAACTAEASKAPADSATADQEVAMAMHTVKCGCAVSSVGKCGNYIEIDGAFVEIANGADLGLGKMEWCGQDAQTAEAAGAVTDGSFVASAFTVGE